MTVLKCKMCGGDLNITGNEKVVECEYCGSKQTIPTVNDDIVANLHNRAILCDSNVNLTRQKKSTIKSSKKIRRMQRRIGE